MATSTSEMAGTAKASLQPEGTKIVLLYSSMSGSLEVKARQNRVSSILKGMHLPPEAIERVNGADPMQKQRRLELFIVSGKTAQYPQLFISKPKEELRFLGNAEDIFYLHDTETLGDAIGLVVHETSETVHDKEGAVRAEDGAEVKTEETAKEEEPPAPSVEEAKKEKEQAKAEKKAPVKEVVIVHSPEKAAEDSKTGDPAMDASLKTTTWTRAPSTRNILTATAVTTEEEDPMAAYVIKMYKGSEPHETAASKIQRVFRARLWPVLVLGKKLREAKEGTKEQVEKIQKDAQKKTSKLQKQYEKDCKKVDKLAHDIHRYENKNKSMKKRCKAEKKVRDGFNSATKLRDKEVHRSEKYTAKERKYKKKVEKEQKMLATWEKDIKAVQAENEKLLGCITNISQLLAVRGVNWTHLGKEEEKPAEAPAPAPSALAAAAARIGTATAGTTKKPDPPTPRNTKLVATNPGTKQGAAKPGSPQTKPAADGNKGKTPPAKTTPAPAKGAPAKAAPETGAPAKAAPTRGTPAKPGSKPAGVAANKGKAPAAGAKPNPGAKPAPGTKPPPAPVRVPPRARLQSMMRREGGRRSVVAMVKQESVRFGEAKKRISAAKKDDGEPPAVHFVRLNSRARLVNTK